mmetsp:Transcript_50516/g.156330  ORF Transcript_50516/g.156330 Transcript_50516/m.156330 type:complete len:85 (-) Transcript_50516:811-1065(-)
MPLIAFIADTSSANGQALLPQLGELEGRASRIVGNDKAAFEGTCQLGEVDVIVIGLCGRRPGGHGRAVAPLPQAEMGAQHGCGG